MYNKWGFHFISPYNMRHVNKFLSQRGSLGTMSAFGKHGENTCLVSREVEKLNKSTHFTVVYTRV